MAMNIVRRLLYSRANRRLIGWAEKIMLPGFSGFSIYHVSRFFFHALFQGNLVNRAAAITYRLFISRVPAISVLLTLIPFIPIHDFQEKLLHTFMELLPWEVYTFIESQLHDLLVKKHATLLSLSSITGLYFASNSMDASLAGFSGSSNLSTWHSPVKQRIISLILLLLFVPLQLIAVMLLLCGAIIALTRYVSLGVLMMFGLAAVWMIVMVSQHAVPFEYLFYTLAISSLILLRFRENIQRLLAGTERRFGERA